MINHNSIWFILNCFNSIENTNAKYFEFIYEKDGSFKLAEEFIQKYFSQLGFFFKLEIIRYFLFKTIQMTNCY